MKKNILKYAGITFLAFSISLTTFGQDQEPPMDKKGKKEQVESAKKEFIKKELELTAEEEKAFWPIYDQMHEDIKAEKQKKSEIVKEIKANKDTMSEADFKSKGEEILKIDKRISEIKLNYFHKIGDAISYKKSLQLQQVERKFKKELLNRLKREHPKAMHKGQK